MARIHPFKGVSPRLHPSVFAVDDALVIGDVEVGEQSSLWFGTVVRGDVNYIRIGSRTNVQDHTVIHVTNATHPTLVGDDVTLGHRVTLHGCTVQHRCLIGIGAVVMDGAVVSEDSMVGAGSLVPPGMVGVKRELTREEIAFFRKSAQNYVAYAEQYRQEGWSSR